MTKTEYNHSLDRLYDLELQPLGFKKNGIHYYLVKGDTVVHLQNGWKRDPMTYLAFSKTWMSFHQPEKNQFLVPPYLGRYPFSISIQMLRRQMSKYESGFDFDYHTNFYDRQNRNISNKDFFTRKRFKRPSLDYAFFVVDVIKNEGLALTEQMSTELLYWSLIKYETYHPTLYKMHLSEYMMQMKHELKAKLQEEQKDLPQRSISKWDDFWLKRQAARIAL